jgi:hypothetical protein
MVEPGESDQAVVVHPIDEVRGEVEAHEGGGELRKVREVIVGEVEELELDVVTECRGRGGFEAVGGEIEDLELEEVGKGAPVQALEVVVVQEEMSELAILGEYVVG